MKSLAILAPYVILASVAGGQTELGTLAASDGKSGDSFGVSVSVSSTPSRNLVLVGAHQHEISGARTGAAYIFEEVAGQWIEVAKLTASDGAQDDLFGLAVDIDGNDTAVVGASRNQVNGPLSGAAYVFERVGTSWVETRKLSASDGTIGDNFGFSVTVAGDTVVIGSRFADAPGAPFSDAGAAYVFENAPGGWQETQRLVGSDTDAGDRFGESVSLAGGTLVVGALNADGSVATSGAAYVFESDPQGWTEVAKLEASDGDFSDYFGVSIASTQSTIVVGAQNGDVGGHLPSRAAYVFENSMTGWSEVAILRPTSTNIFDLYGMSVAVSRDSAFVGAQWDDSAGFFAGVTYRFEQSTGFGWIGTGTLGPAGLADNDVYGQVVAMDGDLLGVGATGRDGAEPDAGAVVLFSVDEPRYPTYCNGDGGTPPGCTPCPCGNHASPGTTGGCFNSVFSNAKIGIGGDASVSNDSLRIELRDGSPNTFAVLVSAENQLPQSPANPCPPGSGVITASFDGLRCIGGSLLRHGNRATDISGDVGSTNNGWGGADAPPAGLIAQGSFLVGQSRNFQVIYRDLNTQVCFTGLNTSNASTIVVGP